MPLKRLLNHADLVRQHRVICSRASAGHACRGKSCERRGDRTGCRGVSDPHFAEPDHVDAGLDRVASHLETDRDRRVGLIPCHRRLARHIPRARRHATLMQAGDVTEIRCDTDIDDLDFGAGHAGQCVDAGAPGEKIRHHLPRHGGRVRRNAFGRDAVVGREHDNSRPLDSRRQRPLNRHHAIRQFLQAAKTARRLRQRRLMRLRATHPVRIEWFDLPQDIPEISEHRCSLLRRIAAHVRDVHSRRAAVQPRG